MTLIGLIVVLLVLGLVWWAVHQIAGAFGIPPQVVVVIDVLLVLLFVVYLLRAFGLSIPMLR